MPWLFTTTYLLCSNSSKRYNIIIKNSETLSTRSFFCAKLFPATFITGNNDKIWVLLNISNTNLFLKRNYLSIFEPAIEIGVICPPYFEQADLNSELRKE